MRGRPLSWISGNVLAIVRTESEGLAKDGDWSIGVAKPLEWIGIDGLSEDAVAIRLSIKTAPLRRFELRRQMNGRICAAFAHDGIAITSHA